MYIRNVKKAKCDRLRGGYGTRVKLKALRPFEIHTLFRTVLFELGVFGKEQRNSRDACLTRPEMAKYQTTLGKYGRKEAFFRAVRQTANECGIDDEENIRTKVNEVLKLKKKRR